MLQKINSLVTAGALLLLTVGGPQSARADTVGPINFESPTYTIGTINGQDGWSSLGAAGSGCALYDHAVASTSAYWAVPGFGGQTLRISNAVTSGCFGDQTFSKSLLDEAGESSAISGGLSGGTRQSRFEASWEFASAVPGAEQPKLAFTASPDRGDGARMSWIQMADTPGGLDVNFYDYQDVAPYGSVGNPSDGCIIGSDAFVFTAVATGLARNVKHSVRVVMDFVDGQRNDVVRVYVDGVLKHTGTSWEDYFRFCEGNPTRTVDSILFRTSGTAAPANAGKGFLIDNLSMASYTPAKTAKLMIRASLAGMLPTGDKKTDESINKAISAIEDSLAPDLWNGASWLTQKGQKVFENEKKAVSELQKITTPAPGIVSAISGLVTVDRNLAVTAIADAGPAGADPQDIAKANQNLAEGDAKALAGDFDTAIESYKNAWQFASKWMN
ncbi:MAG: hypothetical protein ABIQ99_17145 [Thermoflexales bacterium]